VAGSTGGISTGGKTMTRKKYHEFAETDIRHPGGVWLELPRESKALYTKRCPTCDSETWAVNLKEEKRKKR